MPSTQQLLQITCYIVLDILSESGSSFGGNPFPWHEMSVKRLGTGIDGQAEGVQRERRGAHLSNARVRVSCNNLEYKIYTDLIYGRSKQHTLDIL